MVITLQPEVAAFDPETFPEWFWVSSLFGRVTHNLVLREELKDAYEIVERELKVVADIQRSLLPQVLPKIPTLELAAYYRTSRWAGGDYYDFFPLPDGRWGILIADVSGHGTPAAVMMAITHSLAHSLPGPADPTTSTAKAGLARWTGEAGHPAGARDQYAALPPIRERVSGPEHPPLWTPATLSCGGAGRTHPWPLDPMRGRDC